MTNSSMSPLLKVQLAHILSDTPLNTVLYMNKYLFHFLLFGMTQGDSAPGSQALIDHMFSHRNIIKSNRKKGGGGYLH